MRGRRKEKIINSKERKESLLFMGAEVSKKTPALDIHGERTERALDLVDKFLYNQFNNEEETAKIITGKGKGILYNAVNDFLSTHPLVEESRSSSAPNEAGAVIYVILSKREN